MDNYLESGGVLPSGLMSGNDMMEKMAGFNKTYKNYPLRVGVISQIYAYNDFNNFSKLSTEYDVQVFEQNEDRGNTILKYKNCIGVDGLGSIADYFEKNFRPMTMNTNPTGVLNTTYQNGSVVILLCLDGVTEKAVIIGGLNHPSRSTKLTTTQPQLYGEYNGVAVAVNPDGSTSLTFNGATDNNGNLVTPGQGPTTVAIATDGTFSVQHSGVTMQLEKNGALNITANGNINITTPDKVVVTAKEIDLNRPDGDEDPTEGIITSAGTYNCVDFITGVPVVPSTTVFGDIGESNV